MPLILFSLFPLSFQHKNHNVNISYSHDMLDGAIKLVMNNSEIDKIDFRY